MTKGFSQKDWENGHLRNVEGYTSAVDKLYNKAIADISRLAMRVKLDPTKPFSFNDYPALKAQATKIFQNLSASTNRVISNGSREQWLYANRKSDAFLNSILDTSKIRKSLLNRMQDRNLDALKTFQARKVNGMNLSERIWQYSGQFKEAMELGIDVGIGAGKSAAQLSRELRGFLMEPNNLFRRVRDKHGNLVLSKAAKSFHPGQGVYRSSYKNAMRLTRSEINMSYRTADDLRWNQMNFVAGFQIKLSNNHTINGEPFKDICDELAGKYPKQFKFVGWHPQCRCYKTPILQDPDEFDTDELNELKAAINGTEYKKYSPGNTITDMPANFKTWAVENQAKVDGYRSTPYFIKDNFKYGKIRNGLKADFGAMDRPVLPKQPSAPPIPKKTEISYADTIDQAKTMNDVKAALGSKLKDALGYDVRIMISETDTSLDIAKAYAKEYVDLCETYNLEVPCKKFYTTQSKRHYGQVAYLDKTGKQTGYLSQIESKSMNCGAMVDRSRLNEIATAKSRCDADRLQLSTVNHEFGHNIHSGVNRSEQALKFRQELNQLRRDYHSEIYELDRLKKREEFNQMYLGRYAGSNIDEFLAEAFQEYRNRKTPSKYARLVGELVDKYFKK